MSCGRARTLPSCTAVVSVRFLEYRSNEIREAALPGAVLLRDGQATGCRHLHGKLSNASSVLSYECNQVPSAPFAHNCFFFVLQVPPYSQKAIVQAVVTGPRGVRRMWGRQLSGQRLLLLSEESR